MNLEIEKKTILAGEICRKVVEYAKSIVKQGVLLIDIANKIEHKIHELGGKPAFPVNLSINEIAAHATPTFNDSEKAHGLLKVDIGVHIDGYVGDTAFSVDLDNKPENKEMIEVAESSLNVAVSEAKFGSRVTELGKKISAVAESRGFVTIHNLTGHSIERYDVHAGTSIPNYDSGQNEKLEEGVYAIEPFVTTGEGRVRDGKPSGIYQFANSGSVRDSVARELMSFIDSEYQGLPFCSRWIHAKFGGRGLLALRTLEQAGILYQYPQLIEVSNGTVAQAEHTLLVRKNKTTIVT